MSLSKTMGVAVIPLALSALSLASSPVWSAGFGIMENGGSGMGNAFAGASAVAEDGTTVWFNPAGMVMLENRPMMSQVLHIIEPSSQFKNINSSVNPALTGGDINIARAILQGKNDDGGQTAVVPNFYFVKPLNDTLRFGIGINAPFGLEITYDDDWIGRYHATKSELLTLNVNPSLSWKASDRLSFGAGVSAQYIEATLGSKIDSAAACRSAASTVNSGTLLAQCLSVYPKVGQVATDSNALVTGDDISYGFNVGMLYKASNKTRFGVSYRSSIKHKLKGDVDFTLDDSLASIATSATTNLKQTLGATSLADRAVTAAAEVPEHISFSVAHGVNDRLELLADATWTGWSSFKELRVVDTTGQTVTVTPEEWEDVWRFSFGGNYKYNNKVTLRSGVAYDESPVPGPRFRTPRLPGNDRTWITVGANYKYNKNIDVDIGYAHLFLDDTPIDHTDDNGYTISGIYEADVDILSAQLNWKF